MQGQTYVNDVLLIELDTNDMVLSIQWLQQLGDITWNFNNLLIKFLYHGEECTLTGIPKQGLYMISGVDMQKALHRKNQVASMQLCRLEGTSYINVPKYNAEVQDEKMSSLLLEYQDVFKEQRTQGITPK